MTLGKKPIPITGASEHDGVIGMMSNRSLFAQGVKTYSTRQLRRMLARIERKEAKR